MSLHLNDTTSSDKLYIAIELSSTEWKLCFGITTGSRKHLRTVEAMNLKALSDEIKLVKEILNLCVSAIVMSYYEAGRDGFCLNRYPYASGLAVQLYQKILGNTMHALDLTRQQQEAMIG